MIKHSFICLLGCFLLQCCIFQLCHSYTCKVRPVDGGVYRDWLIESSTGNHTISAICECNTFSSTKTEPLWRQLTQTTGGTYKSVPKTYTMYDEEQNTTTLMNYTVTESTVLMCGDSNQNYAKAIDIDIIEPNEECSMTNNSTQHANTTISNTTSKWNPEDTCTSTAVITATQTLITTQTITSTVMRVGNETTTQQPTSRPTVDYSPDSGEDNSITSNTSIYIMVIFGTVILVVAVLQVVLLVVIYKLWNNQSSSVIYSDLNFVRNEPTPLARQSEDSVVYCEVQPHA